ncbi:MAG: glycosyltransferase family 4 protein [Hyphomicrobiales bacterium]|nr:glycosyltransferase family 4 protein [Hyphomicrobiales bacterium]
MKARPVLYDLSGLFSRVFERTPNGIARVDLAFADHFLSSDDDCFGLMWSVIGPRVFSRSAAREVLEIVRRQWGEAAPPEEDENLASVVAALRDASPARRFSKGRSGQFAAALAWIAKHGAPFGDSAIRLQVRHGVYLNVGQYRIESDRRMRWLEGRPDIAPVFFIHDLLPLQLPEYFRAPDYARHSLRLATVARRARAVLVSSGTVRTALARHLSALGRPDMPIFVAPLAPDPIFAAPDVARPDASGALYFLMCGTIEPRKNHLLILQVWRDLADRLGDRAPKLVLVGEHGWEDEHIRDLLDRSPRLSRHVVEVSGLHTPSLKRLMLGARALLMPSFGEGYGLPVVEALAAGLPVIASDIPIFREIGDGRLTLIDPTDGPRWREAICAFADEGRVVRPKALANMAGYRPPSWPGVFETVETFLVALTRTDGPQESEVETELRPIGEPSSR